MHAGASPFADASAARRSVEMALPMIEQAVRDPKVCGTGFLAVVVMDPASRPEHGPFDAAVLYEHAIGDRSAWDADYTAFARAKARLAWREQCDGWHLQATRPQALRTGDSLLEGAVCLEGIVVAVSGAMPWFDEAFATCIAANLRAIAKQRRAVARDRGLSAAPHHPE